MSLARPISAVVIAAGVLFAGTAPAHADSPGDRITALAAGANTLFALRSNAMVAFDGAGREVARCLRFDAASPERRVAPMAKALDAEEALRLAGLPDDDLDSSAAEEVLDDEGLSSKRRARPALEDAIIAHALAASPADDDVWIATSAGVFRGRAGVCTRVALPHRDAIAIAAAAGAVAVATEQLLWRSDGSATFRVAAGIAARPRALAIVDEQHTLVATDDAILEVGPYGITRTVLDRGGDALAVCGGVAVAFAGDGVWTWTGDTPPRRAGDRPLARTLSCGDGRAARFIATGDAVYASSDGAAWRQRRAWPGRSLGAAAAVAGRIWVAVEDAVLPLDDTPAAALSPAPPVASPAPLPDLPPLTTARLTTPFFPWPQLTVVFAGQRTALRDGWSVVVLVGFHLGRATISAADRRHLAAELVRRDAELAAQELQPPAPAGDDAFQAARLRALRQERKALR
jgi:hypothetical protein